MKRENLGQANWLAKELEEIENRRRQVAGANKFVLSAPLSYATIQVGGGSVLDASETRDLVMTARARLARGLREKALEYYDEEIARIHGELKTLGVEMSEAA